MESGATIKLDLFSLSSRQHWRLALQVLQE